MKKLLNQPIIIASTRAWRTYLGGKQLDERDNKINAQDSNFPEEWMFSVTQAKNLGREDVVEGLCTLTKNL